MLTSSLLHSITRRPHAIALPMAPCPKGKHSRPAAVFHHTIQCEPACSHRPSVGRSLNPILHTSSTRNLREYEGQEAVGLGLNPGSRAGSVEERRGAARLRVIPNSD
ncbi:hypothetical protein P171DRAFT_251464 [Karstenula rhodostoma CBS 690.94]|uniref:Uncharacterized protein n=1 Tax=Karstenula rhodostoma CBS 690.94 TaxID=1392251 RepID=A0A9P4PKV6_9PLEO|nr:hypothetical protein P171DRAFT_251464 [Karstenula rhodostoma CBS 690.94]